MDNKFIEEFSNTFDDSQYPVEFLKNYETLECLANSPMGETLLVKELQTGNLCVAKCFSDNSLPIHSNESDVLKMLHHDRLPAFIAEYHNDEMRCVVREFVEGVSLDRYAASHKLSQDQIISIAVQLCDDIAYLHAQRPPVIHRDIKPQNIVIDENLNPRLIDFGCSRIYNADAQEDTVCFGTRHFAAPEQYGFSQTDCRTDIFSFGILLGWMLTGETDAKTSIPAITNKRLQRIAAKCTNFAPEKRYPSITQVKKDLLAADGKKQSKVFQALVGLIACTAFLCLGFVVGRFTEFSPSFLNGSKVIFEEPLVEQAVRLSLNKSSDEPITENELLNITEIYIYGDQAVSNSGEFENVGDHMMLNDGTVRNGGISSLKDLAKLKNLRKVNIALENINDLSPLAKLDKLEQIQLKHNPIEDLKPLAELLFLRELFIYDTYVSDLSVLATCPMLENIDIGKTYVTSLESLEGIDRLNSLSAPHTSLGTLSGIEQLSSLQYLRLSSVEDGNLLPLLDLPQLQEVYLDESLREATSAINGKAQFQIIFN